MKETIGNLVRQLKETNIEKDELIDENMKGKKVLEVHEKQIKELLATWKKRRSYLNNRNICSTNVWRNMPSCK